MKAFTDHMANYSHVAPGDASAIPTAEYALLQREMGAATNAYAALSWFMAGDMTVFPSSFHNTMVIIVKSAISAYMPDAATFINLVPAKHGTGYQLSYWNNS